MGFKLNQTLNKVTTPCSAQKACGHHQDGCA